MVLTYQTRKRPKRRLIYYDVDSTILIYYDVDSTILIYYDVDSTILIYYDIARLL